MPSQPLLHGEITSAILRCSFAVAHELGCGFLESVYERSLEIALRQDGLGVQRQFPISVRFRGQAVGEYYADLFVESRVLVELKACNALLPEHEAQVVNYLKATGLEVGLLINFGTPKVQYRRFTRRPDGQAEG